jgi:sugar fermentation stimulation protein A
MSIPPFYFAAFRLPEPRTIEVGAFGIFEFDPGDYVYVGRASRGLDARLARHQRRDDKTLRWHVDYVRDRARWLRAHVVDAGGECELADRIAALPGASRPIEGFGASDCRCDGHLIRLDDLRAVRVDLPGVLWPGDGVRARFVERPNRFVVRAELDVDREITDLVEADDGDVVEAYLPNTSRLGELVTEGRPILLEPSDDPERSTDFTVRRFWDDTWVSVEATRAEEAVEDWMQRRGELPELGPVESWERQVERAGHRFDFHLSHPDGDKTWLEVKSLSRAESGAAHLSKTPSSRADAHLETLGDFAESGERAALIFVLQRDDVEMLEVGGDADPGWIESVRRAADRGVDVLASRTRVTPSNLWIEEKLPLRDVRASSNR